MVAYTYATVIKDMMLRARNVAELCAIMEVKGLEGGTFVFHGSNKIGRLTKTAEGWLMESSYLVDPMEIEGARRRILPPDPKGSRV